MTKHNHKAAGIVAAVVLIAFFIVVSFVTDADSVQKSGWALLPPVIAISLALITKEAYSSLFIGIVTGGLLYSGFSFRGTMTHCLKDGFVSVLTDPYNVGILLFLVILGAIVSLMNRAGGSAAFGRWARTHIKTRVGAQLATIALGILIFIDDYFNCLTVGSVMRPVTDGHHVSRAKLAYIIDATAAPVCIIAPISSWAAAVSGFVKGANGLTVFCQAIPYNFYALFTILMMFMVVGTRTDFGPMATHEKNALRGDLFTTPDRPYGDADEEEGNVRGRVIDLVFPILCLIACCVIGMLANGGFFGGKNVIDAFAGCDASVGLSSGSLIALIIIVIYYICRGLLSFRACMDALPAGFKAMVPAILILVFAWTLKTMTDSLGAADFVAGLIGNSAAGWQGFLPCIIFLIGVFLAFATGTSWGTFGILIPIVIAPFAHDHRMMIIAISACMAGAVCGDHCSPISDTTIMASAGAQCNHVNHVNTQLPYAMLVAGVSAVTYIIAGFTRSAVISLPCGAALLIVVILLIHRTKGHRIEMPPEAEAQEG